MYKEGSSNADLMKELPFINEECAVGETDSFDNMEVQLNNIFKEIDLRRNCIISDKVGFWDNVLLNHPKLSTLFNKTEGKMLMYLEEMVVRDFRNSETGRSISFYFEENPYFKNRVLTKLILDKTDSEHYANHEAFTAIKWTLRGSTLKNSIKDVNEYSTNCFNYNTFFDWFVGKQDLHNDQITTIITDIWSNPMPHYDHLTYSMFNFYNNLSNFGEDNIIEINNIYKKSFAKLRIENNISKDDSQNDEDGTFNDGDDEDDFSKEYSDNRKLDNIPYFWVNAFKNHPRLSQLITPEEQLVLKFIQKIEIKHFFLTKTGFRISIYFHDNPYFTNKIITKWVITERDDLNYDNHETCTQINWKNGNTLFKNIMNKQYQTYISFFHWFVTKIDLDVDEIAKIISEIWQNPFLFYQPELSTIEKTVK